MTSSSLARVSPESVGLSSKSVLDFLRAINEGAHGLHSLMVLRHGSVLTEAWWKPYQRDDLHLLYSLSKSFTSSAIGLAQHEGLLSIDDSVLSFFPGRGPETPSENLKKMKVRHLLSMSCGHENDDMADMYMRADGDWVRGFLCRDVPHEPGTHFLYNSSASYVLSAIIQQVTGQTTLDYIRPRLLAPIGVNHAEWEVSPEGVSMGGWGMSLSTESIARFGQLLLQKGSWNGDEVLPAPWVENATSFQVSNAQNDQVDWQQGYGFQFWLCRFDGFRGDGAFGQFCVVLPDQDLVVAITAATPSMQAVLNLVWQHLVEPLQQAALPEDPASVRELEQNILGLVLTGPKTFEGSTKEILIAGKTFESTDPSQKIQSCQLDFDDEGCTLILKYLSNDKTIRAGTQTWISGQSSFEIDDQKVAALGAWVSSDTFEIQIWAQESPSGTLIRCRFDDNSLELTTTYQYRFGPTEGPTFLGKIA